MYWLKMGLIIKPLPLMSRASLFSLLVISLFCSSLYAQNNQEITATLSTTSFALDGYTVLTITVNGATDITIPQVDNLVIRKQGHYVQRQIINRTSFSTVTFTYSVRAQKPGKYTIPPIMANLDGDSVQSEPLSFEVTANQQTSPNSSSGTAQQASEIAFARIAGIKGKVYTGEIIPVEIKAYFQSGLRAEIHKMPELQSNGLVMSPLNDEPQQSEELYNNRKYSVISWQTSISPIKEGEYELAIDMNTTLLIPQRNRRSRFSDPFFDDDLISGLFGGYARKNITLSIPKESVSVLPLPDKDKPENFGGAIGDFDFSVSATPTTIDVGDPITLTMKITGKGNFDRVTAPIFDSGKDWKTYSASSEFINSGKGYEGEKLFEQAIVAKNNEIDVIPSLSFSYFDPRKHRYISITSPPLAIQFNFVAGGQQSQQVSSITNTVPATQQPQDLTRLPLASIRLHAGSFSPNLTPIFYRSWFIVTLILCSVIVLAVFLMTIWKRYYALDNNLQEKKRIEKILAEKLKALQLAQTDNNSQDFLQNCREIIQVQLGSLWHVEPSAITPFDLQMKLPADSPLIQIFAEAEQHAYGGGGLSDEQMQKYSHILKKELEQLS